MFLLLVQPEIERRPYIKGVIPNYSYYEQQFLCRPLTQAGEQRGREENSANSNIIRQLPFGRKACAI